MYLVRIAQLEPGQRLAKAVTNANGAVLCPAGFELTESAIARLRNAGVESVVLEGGSSNADAIKERIGALDARFEGVTDPAMIRIKETVENRLRSMLPGEES